MGKVTYVYHCHAMHIEPSQIKHFDGLIVTTCIIDNIERYLSVKGDIAKELGVDIEKSDKIIVDSFSFLHTR